MKLLSFIDEVNGWSPVEVELELWPGLPEIHFLGRPDQHLRESAKRIKSAIKSAGFDFPVGQQILVNLRPSYLKKSSRGIELAVAAAYLMASGQLPRWVNDSRTFFYGELSLSGEVGAPAGIAAARIPGDAVLITGASREGVPFPFREVKTLRDLLSPLSKDATWSPPVWRPPEETLDFEIPVNWARTLGVIALGGHSILMAGAGGSGKTTAAKILHALLPVPEGEEVKDLWRATPESERDSLAWRPLIQPHHTIPTLSLLGGGAEAHGGELARADRGLLLLDEFFEFSPHAMEALREPLEQKRMRVSRGSRVREYPMRAQIVGTTNLCPCGDFVPGGEKRKKPCRFSLAKCNSYSEKISGPLLDRFETLVFLGHRKAGEKVRTVRSLREEVEEKRDRLRARASRPTDSLSLQKRMEPFYLKDWRQRKFSERRRLATLRVAATLADWDGREKIGGAQLEEALWCTFHPFEKIRRWDLG